MIATEWSFLFIKLCNVFRTGDVPRIHARGILAQGKLLAKVAEGENFSLRGSLESIPIPNPCFVGGWAFWPTYAVSAEAIYTLCSLWRSRLNL